MSVNLTSPVTGTVLNGFTAPTYTLTVANPADNFTRNWIVSAVGGTQGSVAVHTLSNPFAVMIKRPKTLKQAPPVDPSTGLYKGSVPKNLWTVSILKGVQMSTPDGKIVTIPIKIEIPLPAGVEASSTTLDQLAGALSCTGGVILQVLPQMIQAAKDGVI
jgi:hypothetical protein